MIQANYFPERAITWIDAETDSLDAETGHLLEVAALLTSLNLDLLDEDGYHAVVLYTPEQAQAMRAAAVPAVQKMHDESGLWDRITDPTVAKPLAQVEAELLAYIKQYVPDVRTARLAGNSVRLDLNFSDKHTPAVSEHLHYRMLDVTSIAGVAQWWENLPLFTKAGSHTAMADIRESLNELRYLRARLGMNHTVGTGVTLQTTTRLREVTFILPDDHTLVMPATSERPQWRPVRGMVTEKVIEDSVNGIDVDIVVDLAGRDAEGQPVSQQQRLSTQVDYLGDDYVNDESAFTTPVRMTVFPDDVLEAVAQASGIRVDRPITDHLLTHQPAEVAVVEVGA